MSARKVFPVVFLGIWAVFAAGCGAGSSTPRGWLDAPSKVQAQAYGAWIDVAYKESSPKKAVKVVLGELIAFEAESLYVLSTSGLAAISTTQIIDAKLTSYDSHTRQLRLWVLGGTLSTLSHGIGLVLSAPAWLLVGNIATISQSNAAHQYIPNKSWKELRTFARFPQGLPPGLDRQSLQPKPQVQRK